jgi:hypothetical protein
MMNRCGNKVLLLVLAMAGLWASLSAVQPAQAADENSGTPKAAAVAAMENWLGRIDGAQYARSWQEAAPLFQQAITQGNWVATLENVRKPLGACIERKLASCALNPSGSPTAENPFKSEYVIAQFDTSFANLKYSIETITFVHGNDGIWKVAGYFIRPK